MDYGINFAAPNNQLIFTRLLGYIWYIYSNMSFGVIGHDFDYDLDLGLFGGDWFDEMRV